MQKSLITITLAMIFALFSFSPLWAGNGGSGQGGHQGQGAGDGSGNSNVLSAKMSIPATNGSPG